MKTSVERETKQLAVEESLSVLQRFLEDSGDSIYSDSDLLEIQKTVRRAHDSVKSCGRILNSGELLCLFSPTGSLQDISIDNGWGSEFLDIAEVIERNIGACK